MRVVIRTYRDGNTKPHHDEYKLDCNDLTDVLEVTEDISSFLQESMVEIEDKEGDDDSSN